LRSTDSEALGTSRRFKVDFFLPTSSRGNDKIVQGLIGTTSLTVGESQDNYAVKLVAKHRKSNGDAQTYTFGPASKAAQGRDHLLDELMAAAAR
jgi:hypothetical protein